MNNRPSAHTIPTVIESSERGERAYDIFSRLLSDFVIMVGGIDSDYRADLIMAQLLFLENTAPDREICMYINSPGGLVTAGLAIYDTMQHIRNDIKTVVCGQAASMGAVLACGGTKGKRFALPNARIMIHQPSGGSSGQATDIGIQYKEMQRLKLTLEGIISKHTGKSAEQVCIDCERDNFMSAEEAIKYGLIDEVVRSTKS